MKILEKISALPHAKKIILVAPVLLTGIILLVWAPNSHLEISPQQDSLYLFTSYSDADEGGRSEVTPIQYHDSGFTFSYTLRQGYQYPYGGVTVQFASGDTFLDISRYNYLSLELSTDKAESFRVYLKTFIDDYSTSSDIFTYYFLMKEVAFKKSGGNYRIDFKDLSIPSWWMDHNKLLVTKIGKPQFAKTISMQLEPGTTTPFDSTFTVTVKKVFFGRNNNRLYATLLFGNLLYYLITILAFFAARKQQKSKPVVIPYKELVVKNDSEEEIRRLTECIARKYSDPELTVEKCAWEAGVSSAKIPVILKREYDMNFKQYLNKIRISEAQRLLKETDNQIVTLAYTVGYNNIPHFNRTFKLLVGSSPKEYRRQFRKVKEEEDNGDSDKEE